MNGIVDELGIALHGIWRRRWLALATAWALALLGWIGIAMIPNMFGSHARIVVDINDVLPDQAGSISDPRQRLDNIRQTMTSARNLAQVATVSGMVPATADPATLGSAVGQLQRAITVKPLEDKLFDITVTMGDGGRSDAQNADLAPKVIQAMITVLRDEQARGGTEAAEQGLKFLDAQLTEKQQQLRNVEVQRSQFEARNLGMIGGASATQRIESARSELSGIETQLATAQSALAAISSQLATTPATISTPGIGSIGGGVARQQLSSAQAELSAMKARGLTDQHPDVIALKGQIEALKQQAARENTTSGGSSTTNPAYSQLAAMRAERQATVSALSARRAQLNATIGSILTRQISQPGLEAEYNRINQDYTVLKADYDRLLAKREQVRLRGEVSLNADAVQVDVLDPPARPTAPSSPNRPLLLIGTLIGALGAGTALAFLLSQLFTTYATTERLEKSSGMPVIGSVNEVKSPTVRAEQKRKIKQFAGGVAGLFLCTALLLAWTMMKSGVGA